MPFDPSCQGRPTSPRLRPMRTTPRRTSFALVGLLLSAALGCGSDFEFAPVTGKITANGNPIPNVFVTYQPVGGGLEASAGPASYAHTDDEGNYELRRIDDEQTKGAVVGTHRIILQHRDDEQLPGGGATSVDLTASESDAADMAAATRRSILQRKIPLQFRNGSVKIEVPPEGLSDANFDLSGR